MIFCAAEVALSRASAERAVSSPDKLRRTNQRKHWAQGCCHRGTTVRVSTEIGYTPAKDTSFLSSLTTSWTSCCGISSPDSLSLNELVQVPRCFRHAIGTSDGGSIRRSEVNTGQSDVLVPSSMSVTCVLTPLSTAKLPPHLTHIRLLTPLCGFHVLWSWTAHRRPMSTDDHFHETRTE